MSRLRLARTALAGVTALLLAVACSDPSVSDVPDLVPPPSDLGNTMPVPSPSPSVTPAPRLEQIKRMLIDSAERQRVNPYLVMGVAWWESGWNQGVVSPTGAIGIMQVEPATAESAGPRLLHRAADVRNAADNIDLGVAVLREDLDLFHGDMSNALIAYYEGPSAVTDWNDQDAGAKRYVWGVYRLAIAFSRGTGPA